MRPMFTVHVGEYLVGEYIERTYPRWNVWVPSKDTGIDLLVSDAKNRKTVSLQVKFSKDFVPVQRSCLMQSRFLALGWWKYEPGKLKRSEADFWVLVLPSLVEKATSFIVVSPAVLLQRLWAIHGRSRTPIQSYFTVTKSKHCWETRGLSNTDHELVALDRYPDTTRDFTSPLNAWGQIEKRLK